MKTIYEPTGKAREYCDLALNIYSGCTNGCQYCSVPLTLKKEASEFHASVLVRPNILMETKARLAQGDIKGREIFLCFSCDPFPYGIDHSITYDIIKAIKDSGNHVVILTKGELDKERLFGLLDSNDKFGVTISCDNEMAKKYEPHAASVFDRLDYLASAKFAGIPTFVSCEPVLQPDYIYFLITQMCKSIDEYKIGKLNYFKSKREIDWKQFGKKCESLCKSRGVKYLIKAGLREEMEK